MVRMRCAAFHLNICPRCPYAAQIGLFPALRFRFIQAQVRCMHICFVSVWRANPVKPVLGFLQNFNDLAIPALVIRFGHMSGLHNIRCNR